MASKTCRQKRWKCPFCRTILPFATETRLTRRSRQKPDRSTPRESSRPGKTSTVAMRWPALLTTWTQPNNGSRMRREPHVRFCERAAVKFHRATHPRHGGLHFCNEPSLSAKDGHWRGKHATLAASEEGPQLCCFEQGRSGLRTVLLLSGRSEGLRRRWLYEL